MRFDVKRFAPLRRARQLSSRGALLGAGAFSVGAVTIALVLAGLPGGSAPAAAPAPSPSASVDDTTLPTGTQLGDFADFQAVQRKPAASAPIHRLPKVHLASVTVDGIPAVPLAAYRGAARREALADPGCNLPWWLLAGIGYIESGHAHSGGSGYAGWNGVSRPPIYGPMLDGQHRYKAIPDTDHGVLDGDRHWDRAVGPMQFLPSTWLTWGPPGHLDGHANPQNIYSATNAAAGYLCASGSDLSQNRAMALAVYSYNHSFRYVKLVLSVGARYAGMTPDQLGVNLLPKDQPAKHRHRHAHRKQRSRQVAGRGTQRATSSSSSSSSSTTSSPSPTTTSPSPSPSSSPSPSPRPVPVPIPTLSPFHIG